MRLVRNLKLLISRLQGGGSSKEKYEKDSSFFMNNNSRFKDFDIGSWTYGNPNIRKGDTKTRLTIGKYCSIASGVQILLGGEHRKDWITTYPFNVIFPQARGFKGHPASKGDVIIGNDVWIGFNAIILSGVIIGNGAIVGAGAVVVKNVPSYSIVAGNPAKIIGYRFSDETINKLEKISWWDWPEEKVNQALPLLLNSSVEEFIQNYWE